MRLKSCKLNWGLWMIVSLLICTHAFAQSSCPLKVAYDRRERDSFLVFRDLTFLSNSIGLEPYFQVRAPNPIRIAIISTGFDGFSNMDLGCTLSRSTEFITSGSSAPRGDNRGLLYLQAMMQLLTKNFAIMKYEPLTSVYDAFAGSDPNTILANLRAAVNHITTRSLHLNDRPVSVVLIPFTPNLLGRTEAIEAFRREIRRLLEARILVIMGSGDKGARSFSGPVMTINDRNMNMTYAPLAGNSRSLVAICKSGATQSGCRARVSVTWNTGRLLPQASNPRRKLEISVMQIPAERELNQEILSRKPLSPKTEQELGVLLNNVGEVAPGRHPDGRSLYVSSMSGVVQPNPNEPYTPRATVSGEFSEGPIFIRVRRATGDFSPTDQLVVTIEPENTTDPGQVKLIPSHQVESLDPLADIENVLVVGSMKANSQMGSSFRFAEESGRSFRSRKPDLWVMGQVSIAGNDPTKDRLLEGTGVSASFAAATATIMYTAFPKILDRDTSTWFGFLRTIYNSTEFANRTPDPNVGNPDYWMGRSASNRSTSMNSVGSLSPEQLTQARIDAANEIRRRSGDSGELHPVPNDIELNVPRPDHIRNQLSDRSVLQPRQL